MSLSFKLAPLSSLAQSAASARPLSEASLPLFDHVLLRGRPGGVVVCGAGFLSMLLLAVVLCERVTGLGDWRSSCAGGDAALERDVEPFSSSSEDADGLLLIYSGLEEATIASEEGD